MIVADASAVIEMLLNSPAGARAAERLLDPGETVAAPHLLDVEVMQVLRRYCLSGELDDERGQAAVSDFGDLPVVRYPHESLRHRIWELRHNVTAYDAVYIALAEALDAPLVTADTHLQQSPGHSASVQLV